MGPPSRGMLGAWLVGLDGHIQFMRQHGPSGDYYIQCYDLLTAPRRTYITKVALSSIVPDALHKELMFDDRVYNNQDKYTAVVRTALDRVNDWPQVLYDRLAPLCETSPAELEHLVLRAAYNSYAFMDYRMFS